MKERHGTEGSMRFDSTRGAHRGGVWLPDCSDTGKPRH
jgi:hypothetical protein